jgi:hypothetical protein
MIVFRTYNVIAPKFKIEDLVDGGIKTLRKKFGNGDFQEDDYLIGIGVKNATEVREVFEKLLELGLAFDEASATTDDFTVIAKEGIWWPVAWLVSNDDGSWFIADVEAPHSGSE